MPRSSFPNHWKGKDGIYCAGFASMGLDGVARDAQMIAEDIRKLYMEEQIEPLFMKLLN